MTPGNLFCVFALRRVGLTAAELRRELMLAQPSDRPHLQARLRDAEGYLAGLQQELMSGEDQRDSPLVPAAEFLPRFASGLLH